MRGTPRERGWIWRLLTLLACVTLAHAVIGGVGAIAALSSAGKPVQASTVALVAGILAGNFAFTGAATAALWRTDLRRSLPAVYLPLLASLALLVWLDPILWTLAGVVLYLGLAATARARFGLDRRWRPGRLHGECPRCGYDLRGLHLDAPPVCPECGTNRFRPQHPTQQL